MRVYFRGNLYGHDLATAMVEDNGKIIYIGSDEEALKYPGQRIDLGNKYVYPGFNDSHMHLVNYGQSLKNIKLEDHTFSLKALLKELEKHKDESKLIIGRGWNHDYFNDVDRFPTKHDLDSVCSDKPIIITRACGHLLVANSKAIELAKINDQVIEGGYYDLTTGIFKENAMNLIYDIIFQPTVEDIKEYILLGQTMLNSYGITSIQSDDLLSVSRDYTDVLTAFEQLRQENKLTIRVYEQAQLPNLETLKEFIEKGYKTGYGDEWFKIGPLKMLGDGSLGARTAFLSKPYNDDASTSGIPIFSSNEIKKMFDYANRNEMQIAIHAIGDGILDWVIEGYEYALNKYPRQDHRHGIVHCQITREDQLKKYQELNLHAYIQSVFLDYDNHIINQRVDPVIAKTSYNYKTLLNITTISNGSDCPVENPDVLKGIQLAVTRTSLDGTGPYLIEQALTRQEAIESYTSGGAYASFEETVKGKLEVGKYCDFVVLSDNILTIDVEKIKDIKVIATYVAGQLVYGG